MGLLIQEKKHLDSVKARVANKQPTQRDIFKPLFCSTEFYIENQHNFKTIKSYIDTELSAQKISNEQICVLWATLLCLLRRPNDWFGGIQAAPLIATLPQQMPSIPIYKIVHQLNIAWPKKLSPQMDFALFLNTVKIKPLPAVVHSSLIKIYCHSYKLAVLNYEPSPLELLERQCKGERVITFEQDYTKWPQLTYGKRDALSFWLHDCVHAEHFFAKPKYFIMQIGFYRFVLNALKQNQWTKPPSPEFAEAFNYLISDMNTHPLHLLKTLRALIDIHCSSHSAENWSKIINSSTPDTASFSALQNMNTPYFSDEDCEASLHFLNGLGAQSYII